MTKKFVGSFIEHLRRMAGESWLLTHSFCKWVFTEIRFGNTFLTHITFPQHGHKELLEGGSLLPMLPLTEAETTWPSDRVFRNEWAVLSFPISYHNCSLFLLSFFPTTYQFGVIESWGTITDRKQRVLNWLQMKPQYRYSFLFEQSSLHS